MKSILLVLAILIIQSTSTQAQDNYASDVSSLDNIIEALYDVISGDKGVKRDWDRFEHLFTEDTRLIPSSKNDKNKVGYRIMTPASYKESAGSYLEENGFFEKEIYRVTETYGSMVHLWSTYESYRTSSDETPFARGINSIQLLNDGERWWIMQVYWLAESKDNPLPAKYLPKN
jgi:hypothetical protein